MLNPGAASFVASEDGGTVNEFDSRGRHLRTVDAVTGVTVFSFGYDDAGRLNRVTDVDGLLTTIERDGAGNPTGIVAPGGKRTALEVDSNGYLSAVENPAGDRVELSTHPDGLLESFRNPRGNSSLFFYDGRGRLRREEMPAGGLHLLTRTGRNADLTMQHESAEGRLFSYRFEDRKSTGSEVRTSTATTGLVSVSSRAVNESRFSTSPTGMTFASTSQGDPRFGMMSPFSRTTRARTPGGTTRLTASTRSVTPGPSGAVTDVAAMLSTHTVNGKTSQSSWLGGVYWSIEFGV